MRILLMFTLQNLSRKFLEKSESCWPFQRFWLQRNLHSFCPDSRAGRCSSNKHECSPFGRLNLRSFSASTCTWIKRLVLFFLCKELTLGPFIKSLTRNWSNLLSKIPGLSGRNCLFSLNATNCRGAKPTGPQSYPPFLPPLWHKITGLVCVSQVHLYKAPKEMLGDRPFLNIYQRGKPLGEMAHDRVCETSQGSSKSSRKKLKWSQDQAISYPWSDGMAFISTVGWFLW